MAKEFEPAPEVEEVARDLINDYHTHLAPIRIEYVFVNECPKERGKAVWARAKKISGLNAWLAQPARRELTEPEEFFVIEVAKPIWLQLDGKARRALVDHELTHCDVDSADRLAIRPHDLEEFNVIVRRHGLWRVEVEAFLEAARERQPGLGFDGPALQGAMREEAERINRGELDGPDGVTMRAEARK